MNSVAKNQETLKKFSVEVTVCFDNIEAETPEEIGEYDFDGADFS